MITFHDAKAMHLICMAFFLSTLIITFYQSKKINHFLFALSVILLSISGIYLSFRVGLNFWSFPKWLNFKIALFVIIVSLPLIINKRFKGFKVMTLWGAIITTMIIIAFSVYKPLFI